MSERAHLKRSDWAWPASLLVVGCLALGACALNAYRFTGGQGGVPLDDSWIHFQFARNLARGDGFSYNPGQPTSGSTAPLWTVLLAAVYCVGGRFPVAGQLLSGACFLALLAATYALGLRLTGSRWAAWLAGMVVALNGRLVWAGLSALEICLFATLSLLAIGAHLTDRATRRYRLRTAALFGLAALSRPEGYLLFALSLADFTLQIGKSANRQISKSQMANGERRTANGEPRNTHHASRITDYALRITHYGLRIIPPLFLFSALVLPYLIFSLRTSGHLLPNTYHAKAVFDLQLDLKFLSLAARYLIRDNPFLLPFYVLGVGVLLRRARLLSLWSAGLPLVYAFLHTGLYHHGRYLMPLIPCNACIGVVGLLEAYKLLKWRRGTLTPPLSLPGRGSLRSPLPRREGQGEELTPLPHREGQGEGGRLGCASLPSPQPSPREGEGSPPPSLAGRGRGRVVAAALVGLLVVVGSGWGLPMMARQYAWNVDNINEMQVALGHWVVAHTPPDALLALNDIGAITYVSERPIVDLAGLITPEVIPLLRAPDRDARLAELMAARGVQYVIIFPNWFPDLAARRDLLEPLYRVTLAHNTIAGGHTMIVYRTRWRR